MGWSSRGYVQPGDWRTTKARVMARDKATCYLCQGHAREVDHIIPVAQGGGHDDGNLAAICVTCHREKTTRETKARQWWGKRKREPEQHPGYLGPTKPKTSRD
jgi:5-methylcytosine-specific restriction protein A